MLQTLKLNNEKWKKIFLLQRKKLDRIDSGTETGKDTETRITIVLNLNEFKCTVKPVYNDHFRDPKFVAVVDRWSLFRGSIML